MKPSKLLVFIPILALILAAEGVLYSQEVTGKLQGSVTDSLGQPVPGVNVTVRGTNLQGVRGCVSDEMGSFIVLAVPPGRVSVRISHAAYQQVVIDEVRVPLGKSIDLGSVVLRARTHDVQEVVVTGERPDFDVGTTYGSNLRPSEFESLPVERNYRNMVSLLPQVNGSYYGDEVNVGGATGFENKYFLDGMEVTDPLIGATGMSLPYNVIQEVEVNAGGYDPEFRSALGGLINAVTYSGTNEFRGSVFGYFTNNRITGHKNLGLLDPTQGDFTNYDVGFGVGGPIVQDQLWFYLAYNPSSVARNVDVPGFGTSVDRTLVHAFATKLSWSASDRLRLVLTVNGDPTVRKAVGRNIVVPPVLLNPDPYFYDINEGGVNVAMNGVYAFGENLLVEVSGGRVNRHDTGEPSTAVGKTEPSFLDLATGAYSGGPGTSWDSFRYSTTGNARATLAVGGHTVKAGIEYKVNGVDNIYDYDNIDRYDDTTYVEYVGKGFGWTHSRVISFFLQDAWQVTRGLTLRGGIRWDSQSFVASNGNLAQELVPIFEPRLGFSFVPDEEGTRRIFGSIGRFSQELALFKAVDNFSENGFSRTTLYGGDPRVSRSGGTLLLNVPRTIQPEIPDLLPQYFDEFSIGYEQSIGRGIHATIQGLYRTLREAIDDVWLVSEGRWQFGNPGRGPLADWPKAQRDYSALNLCIERQNDERFNFLVSYTLSRDYGNYEGIFDAFSHGQFPNGNASFNDLATARVNATGLIPNDRTHVFKLSGSYRFAFGLSLGASFLAESGTPLSEYAYTDVGIRLLTPRGSVGRTPALWDLNARFTYEIPILGSSNARLIADVFHIASGRKPVDFDQVKYRYADPSGSLAYPNPTYGRAFRYQLPMSMRVGMEINF